MDIEFHYWMTGIIAKEAGFSEQDAATIAYSSEFVDENDVCLTIEDNTTGKKYYNFISQTMNILKPKDKLMQIYPIFHFVPGEPQAESARRRDGKMHLLNTTPDNELANDMMSEAFKSTEDMRLYRIGIATHTYVDTWAHQNFVGWYDNFNAVGTNILPNIGHADGKHHPDWPGHRWDDERLVNHEINNNLRFLSAAKRLFEHYCDHLEAQGAYKVGSRPQWSALENKLCVAMGPVTSGDSNPGKDARIARYRDMFTSLPKFDEETWFDDAIKTVIRGREDSHEGFLSKLTIFEDKYYWRDDRIREDTNWFRFQEAIKAHERLALNKLAPIFKQLDVDIHNV
ncbi:MAG: hypothetical protein CO187_02295 [Zetaproteobacteria bacterium CG_4_9_14_3_um_filter_53_7]|nr:MAG: hypothetical protein CO187_02295 [Zetaproteobacteria bacterium CG_4_9_14_3_um_filter_53_7]